MLTIIGPLISIQDKEFLRQIAGCGEYASRDEFDRLWQWMYPISVALSSPQLQSTWESEDPKWIEGMICRKDAETLLKANEAISSKPGSFLLRFASSRIWPHPDAGALVVSYVGRDMIIYHKLLTLDLEIGQGYVCISACFACLYEDVIDTLKELQLKLAASSLIC